MTLTASDTASFKSLWGEGAFRRFFISRSISFLGDALPPTALALSLLERGSPVLWLGGILAAALLPKVLFLAFGGIAADRFDKLPLMIWSSVLCGTAQLITSFVLVTDLSLWLALTCQVVYGISMAVGHPATFGYLPHCVRPAQLGPANAMLGAWAATASLLGPAITAGLAALWSPALALGVDGLSFLLAGLLLVGLPPGGATGQQPGGLAALRDGWAALRSLPWLLRMTLVDSLILLFVAAPVMVLGPGIVQRVSVSGWALLMLCFAAGELCGSLSGRVRFTRPILVAALGLLAMAAPPALLAARAGITPLCVAQFFAGASVSAYGVLVNTAIQKSVPADRLSRVGAISSMGSFAFLPLGYVLAPVLAAAVGTRPLLWIAAGWTVLSVLMLVSDRDLRAHGARGDCVRAETS